VSSPATIERFPTGLRRRLAMAFVAVAGVAAGVLAIGAATVVTSYRHHSFRERARVEAAQDIALLDEDAEASSLVLRLQRSEQPGGPDVLVIEDGVATSSVDTLGGDDVPARLRRLAQRAPGERVEGTTQISGDSFYLVGQRLPNGAEAYFFFSRTELLRGLSELRVTLIVGWVLVVTAAAVVGTLVARRTLRPVQEAADAARSVTEGLLATRLSVSGNDEFGQWAASFNEMVAALEEKIVALERSRDRERRFNADVAHELRTPLGSLVTAATLAEQHRDDLPAHLQRPADLVVAGARRLHRLVDELLELHRLESGHEVVEREEVDVVDAITTALVAHGWDEPVTLDVQARPLVLSDRRRIDRIICNLVSNALDHGGSDVTVVVAAEGGAASLAVIDRGPGIAEDHLPHLFDRYFKVNPSRTAPANDSNTSGGSGLGLAIASEQARLLGGSLAVDSVVGHGSTFTFRIPIIDDDHGDL
jgi:signal transduction histidine kinase